MLPLMCPPSLFLVSGRGVGEKRRYSGKGNPAPTARSPALGNDIWCHGPLLAFMVNVKSDRWRKIRIPLAIRLSENRWWYGLISTVIRFIVAAVRRSRTIAGAYGLLQEQC
jgi:hypothetical protein